MTELDTLDQIEALSGKNDKRSILEAANKNQNLFQLLDAALNFKRKFLIKKFEMFSGSSNSCTDKHKVFIWLLERLESGVSRGDAARSEVEEFMRGLSDQQRKWYSRVIRKDLKAGFSIESAIKCGFDIPTFEVQLAKDGKKSKSVEDLVKKGGYASRKFDGYRCLAEVIDGIATLYSRNGTEYTNFPVVKVLEDAFPTGKKVFDGEVMSSDFQSMQKSAFANKRQTFVGDVCYYVFDEIPFEEWEKSQFKTLKSVRIENLKQSIVKIPAGGSGLIAMVDQVPVSSMDKILELEQKYISEGYEGVMFVPNVPYYLGRKSNRMLKFKTMQSQDVRIIALNEGEKDSKYEGMMGSVTVLQEDGLQCDCGSGFDDESRKYMWDNKDEFIGKVFETKYQDIGSQGKMRFPVFFRWRHDKTQRDSDEV